MKVGCIKKIKTLDDREVEKYIEDESVLCAITLENLYEPVLTNCGHTFESESMASVDKCPACRTAVNYINLLQRPNRLIQAISHYMIALDLYINRFTRDLSYEDIKFIISNFDIV